MMHITNPVLVLVGPTAIGKTALSIAIAKTKSCEIISMDSMQVYRHMNVGTAKVMHEEMEGIPHFLIDIIDPDQQYNAASFARDALDALQQIIGRGNIPLLTGGTGLYLRALTQGLFAEPQISPAIREQLKQRLAREGSSGLHKELERIDSKSAQRIHPNDKQRIVRALEVYYSSGKTLTEHLAIQQNNLPVSFDRILKIGLYSEREALCQRIALRSRNMFSHGLIEETQKLRNMGYSPTLPSQQAIGYRHANYLIDGKLSRDAALDTCIQDTRHYAKRQMTWFRADKEIIWLRQNDTKGIENIIDRFLNA